MIETVVSHRELPEVEQARRPRSEAGLLLLVALAYLGAHKLAYLFPSSGGVVAAIWPASGIALAALLLNPRRLWPALLAVSLSVNLTVELIAGRGLQFELGILAANLIETLGSAWLITTCCRRPVTFRRVDEVGLLICAALLVNGVSALLGAGAITFQSGRPFWVTYRTWWTGDALGLILLTPLIVSWARPSASWRRLLRWPAPLEAVGAFALAGLIGWFDLGPGDNRWLAGPHTYLMFLPLIWVALRLGLRGTTAFVTLIAIAEVAATAMAWGAAPLGGGDPVERVLRVQLLLGTQCIVALLLGASFAERRASEESLRANESRLRALSDHLPDSMVYQTVREPDGSVRFVHVSAGVERLNGLSPEALRRDPGAFYRQLLPEDRRIVEAAEQTALRSMTLFDVFARMRRADGEIRWMHLRSQPRRQDDGRIVWDGIETDVTGRRQMEDALRGSEEKFSKVFRSSPVAIAITGLADGRFIDANAAMERFLGYARNELMGHTTLELGLWKDERDRRMVVEELARTGQVEGLELSFRTKSGGDAFAQYAAELIEIRGARCILSVLADVTSRKRAKDELRRVNRALRTISNCNQAMVRARDELTLLRDICQVMVEDGGHRLAWVGYPERDDRRSIRVAGVAGDAAEYLERLDLTWSDTLPGRNPVGQAVRTGQPVACHDYLHESQPDGWRDVARQVGFQSSLALPLKSGGEVLGVLSIHSEDGHAFDDEEIKLHSELADDLAFGLQALRERRRHEAAETEVRRLLQEAERSRSALLSILEDQRRTEEALVKVNARYARHEAALSTLSRSYALKPEDLNGVLREIARVVARTIEVGRVSMWTYNGTRSSLACLELFEQDSGRHSQGEEIPRSAHEPYFSALDSSDLIAAADAQTDPRTVTLGAYLRNHGIGAMLDVPLHTRGTTTGVICCEYLGGPRQWTPDEQTFAVAVANLVSMLLAQLEQQALESQLRQNQKLEALGTLAGGIAHDFNNILGAIISFTELSRMDHPHDAELQENLGEVLKASKRAAGLVRQILAFSRQQRQERRRIQLAPVVREALILMRSTLPARIEMQSELAENLPPVLADPTQIHQVVMNLCANAGHAIHGKAGVLRVRLELMGVVNSGARDPNLTGGDRQIRLTVSDNGHGMDPATLDRIFDPFFTTKGPGEGTGLGLAVVHGIVRDHDGSIEVLSEPGVGTTFHVNLPAAVGEDRVPAVEAPFPAAAGGRRILFVDDEAPLAEAARRLLGRYGFQVETESRPEDALSLVRREPERFDAVITDLTMPTMSGTELASDLLEVRSRLPIFVMTGNAGDLTTDSVKALGVCDLVTKPLDYHVLAGLLNESIARYRGGLSA